MADRVLTHYAEPTSVHGFRHEVEIQRLASGQPGILVTAAWTTPDGNRDEITVLVPDGREFLEPVNAWLDH